MSIVTSIIPIEPKMTWAQILERATADGKARGWTTPIGSLFYGPAHGVYQVFFFEPGDDHGAAGVGPPSLFYDSEDGRPLGASCPGSAPPPTSSCRCSSRCIRDESWVCPAAS